MTSVSVPVPPAFVAYVESVLVRLGYLYSDVAWSFDPSTGIIIAQYQPEAHSCETLAREASFQLYREKIHHDTVDIRRKIYGAI